MKVGELIEKLKKFDAGTEVIGYSEDSSLLETGAGAGFVLLDISTINLTNAEMVRLNGRPYFKFGRGLATKQFVALDLTADF